MQLKKHAAIAIALGLLLLAACTAEPEPTPTPIPTPDVTPTATPEPSATPALILGSDPLSQGLIARRNGDYARALAAFQAVLAANPAPDLAQEAQYRLGETNWLLNDDARAITVLTAYLQTYPGGAHAAETHPILANAYRTVKDYANAIAELQIYRGISQTLVGDTDAEIADVMVLAGDAVNAIGQYDTALKDPLLTTTARINIHMRAADVYSGSAQPAPAAARYETALALAVDARTRADLAWRAGESYAAAGQVDKAIALWNEALKYPEQAGAYKSLVDLVNRSAPVDYFLRGLVDYYANANDAAINAFQNHLKTESPRVGDTHFYLALLYARKGSYTKAISEYDLLFKEAPEDKRTGEAYLGKAGAYALIGKIDDAVAVYKKFATSLPDDDKADDALWRAATLLDRSQRYADAAVLYESVQSKYPERDNGPAALYWAGFDYYRLKNTQSAMARWQTLVKTYPESAYYARGLFWLGKAAQALGRADYKTYWTQAAGLAPSYYQWRARDLLTPVKSTPTYEAARYAMDGAADRAAMDKWMAGWSQGTAAPGLLDASVRGDILYRRGAELLRLDRTVEARREFTALIASKQSDARALYALALTLRDSNLYSLSIECAEQIAKLAGKAGATEAPRLLWMLRYPTYYGDLVLAESKTNKIDPLLYFALIRQESVFNPWATSSADARGLGQIMPSTASDIAKRLGVKNYAIDQLYLPFVSIRFGVWYLAQDLKTLPEPIWALAAYNAGAGRANKWQQADLDYAVEEIDLSETALYVRIVYGNWRQYQQIYK